MQTGSVIELASPYGALRTPGNGQIANGTRGTLVDAATGHVRFDSEREPVKVPSHWLHPVDSDNIDN